MMPGVYRLRDGTYGGMKRDEPRCVVAAENLMPYAVGTCCLSEEDIAREGKKGRG